MINKPLNLYMQLSADWWVVHEHNTSPSNQLNWLDTSYMVLEVVSSFSSGQAQRCRNFWSRKKVSQFEIRFDKKLTANQLPRNARTKLGELIVVAMKIGRLIEVNRLAPLDDAKMDYVSLGTQRSMQYCINVLKPSELYTSSEVFLFRLAQSALNLLHVFYSTGAYF